eukprot:13886537-Alexandrium_andersonii.AAC.1
MLGRFQARLGGVGRPRPQTEHALRRLGTADFAWTCLERSEQRAAVSRPHTCAANGSRHSPGMPALA